MRTVAILLLSLLTFPTLAQTKKAAGQLPPPGKPLPANEQTELTQGVDALEKKVANLRQSLAGKPEVLALLPDVQIYVNAVRYPLVYGEAIDFKKAKAALDAGSARAKELAEGKAPWVQAGGPRGYLSKIDGSVQPYLLSVPENYTADHNWRVDIFCHGRGETLLELPFINGRSKPGTPDKPYVPESFFVQPYGRFCCANKFAGEIDSLEILDSLKKQYKIDDDRVILTGFSMGGAAVWHMAVHYPDVWCAASPGAGFAEIEQYQHLEKTGELATLPSWQKSLFHWYDATDYARNLFNLPLIAYAGTEDPQQQSGDVMSKACDAVGIKMQRIYGQGVPHKYEPKAKAELEERLTKYAEQGIDRSPAEVKLETWTLRYNEMRWVTIDALAHHWQRATVEASQAKGVITAKTQNVTAISFTLANADAVDLDGVKLPLSKTGPSSFEKLTGTWKPGEPQGLRKETGLQGPIDDAFLDSFLMVSPTGKPLNEKVGQWADSEMKHAVRQWHNIFRGDAPQRRDADVTDADIAASNLVLWGDPSSNKVLARIVDKLPIKWTKDGVTLRGQHFDAATHAPILIYPNPLNPKKYVVLNSGFTFREDANGTNSRQIPRLPDYAIIDVSVPADSHYPGKIEAAGFFGERWELP